MYEKILNKYAIKQIAYVVDDLEAAARDYTALFGAGPWFQLPPFVPAKTTYRGETDSISLSLDEAYGHYGDLQVELIKVPEGDKAIFGKTGFHHFAIWADDVDAALAEFAEAGFETVLVMENDKGMTINFIDCTEKWGHYIELYGPQEFLCGMTAKLASKWDGSEPLYMDMRAAMAAAQ